MLHSCHDERLAYIRRHVMVRHAHSSDPSHHVRQSTGPSTADRQQWEKTLHDTFGIEHLRPGQEEVIESVLNGRNTLAIMPTGAGKSLCYQLPALKIPGVTVVVSPLIALMKEQSMRLEENGLGATEVNSALSVREERSALQRIGNADYEFIFTTPERLSDPEFLETVRKNRVSLFVIDEAHCISHWGHDFRPAYLHLDAIIEALGNPTVLALTATATDAVIEDIQRQLGLADMHVVNTGIYRPNLQYRVITATGEAEKLDHVLRLVREIEGAGIVYAATVKVVAEVYKSLQMAGERVTFYHGQLSAKVRTQNQDMFMSGEQRIMVATNAFGMGIDKSDIRFVIHYQLPASLAAYYQESGRAGRDRAPARCILLYFARDKQVQQFFLARRYPGAADLGAVYFALQKLCVDDSAMPLSRLPDELGDISEGKLQVSLKLLKDGGLVTQDDQLGYRLLRRNAKPRELVELGDTYRDKRERDQAALERMVFYAQTGFCRWKVMLEYFGEHVDWEHCGTCDNCCQPPAQSLSAEHPQWRPLPAAMRTHKKPSLDIGSTVSVPRFGEGIVASVAGDKVTITFPNGNAKTFLREYVTLKSRSIE